MCQRPGEDDAHISLDYVVTGSGRRKVEFRGTEWQRVGIAGEKGSVLRNGGWCEGFYPLTAQGIQAIHITLAPRRLSI